MSTLGLVLLIGALCLVPRLVVSEEFFQRRDRQDNVRHRTLTDKNTVTSVDKAEEVLQRYGYLRCGSRRSRTDGQRGRRRRPCSEDEFRQALLQYQQTYNMLETGVLDENTLRMMSESRCGNRDDETTAAVSRPMIRPKRRGWRKRNGRIKRRVSIDSKKPGPTVRDFVMRSLGPLPLPDGTTFSRRKRWLERYRQELDSGQAVAREKKMVNRKRRQKRSPSGGQRMHAFPSEVVTWRLIGSAYSNQMTTSSQRSALALAFRMWGEVIPLIFQEDTSSAVDEVDILIAFGRGEHMNCPNHFDGYGGQLSHAIKMAAGAEIHVDDDEFLTVGSTHGTNLVKVAVHEVGHALGLVHNRRNSSIMYAIYSQFIPNNNFELQVEDRRIAQSIYGICKNNFDTVFDWVRRRADGAVIYNTYFFRGPRYWMYENRFNRTRYGDPLLIVPEWKGIPSHIDGYAHIWDNIHDDTYFFKGTQYWKYNSVEDVILPGYPRNISDDFRAIPKSNFPKIPGNIDSVVFDKRDGNLYFFKNNLVYAYDISRGQEGCCLPGFPRPMNKQFPPTSPESRLPNNLDAVYYSYTDRTMYFFKGVNYWENVAYNTLDRRRTNRVKGPFQIAAKWYDICEVEF